MSKTLTQRIRGAAAAALLVCLTLTPAAAADVKISAMPSATALDGTEVVPILQGGANKKATAAQVKTYSQSGLATIATSGSASDLGSGTIPAARLPVFDNATKGAVPASGGGTSNFLRADGSWVSPVTAPPSVTSQSGTAYTGVLGDANSYIRFTNAAAVTFTIPANASVAYPVGTVIEFEQAGAGAVSVTCTCTINSRGGASTTAGIYAVGSIKKVATDTWTLTGDLL